MRIKRIDPELNRLLDRMASAWLGDVSHMTVHRRLLPDLFAAFGRAYGLVRTIRLKPA